MQAPTSTFPSSTRGLDHAQLDNIIFYSGPAAAKPRRNTPTDGDEWTDIDTIFAGPSPYVRMATIEHLDLTGGMETVSDGEPCFPGHFSRAACRLMRLIDIPNAIDEGSTARPTIFTPAHSEDISTPPSSPVDRSRGGVADEGGSQSVQSHCTCGANEWTAYPPGLLIRFSWTSSKAAETLAPWSRAVLPTTMPVLRLWEAFCGEGSTFTPTVDDLPVPTPTLEMDE